MEHVSDLPYPYSSGVSISRHGNMRDLRIQYRLLNRSILFCSSAPRPIGHPDDRCLQDRQERFYEHFMPIADALYDTHLEELPTEGFFKGAGAIALPHQQNGLPTGAPPTHYGDEQQAVRRHAVTRVAPDAGADSAGAGRDAERHQPASVKLEQRADIHESTLRF